MVEFETLEEREVELPKGRLLVALKKVLSEKGETKFVSISKADENGRFKQTLTIPRNAEVVEELADALKSVQAPKRLPESLIALSITA